MHYSLRSLMNLVASCIASISRLLKFEMTDDNKNKIRSPLEQSLTRDGKTIQIGIYQDVEGSWILEVVDKHWNSTVWDEPFQTDREALDEALKTIDEEGIDSFIGDPPDSLDSPTETDSSNVLAALSNEEMDEL